MVVQYFNYVFKKIATALIKSFTLIKSSRMYFGGSKILLNLSLYLHNKSSRANYLCHIFLATKQKQINNHLTLTFPSLPSIQRNVTNRKGWGSIDGMLNSWPTSDCDLLWPWLTKPTVWTGSFVSHFVPTPCVSVHRLTITRQNKFIFYPGKGQKSCQQEYWPPLNVGYELPTVSWNWSEIPSSVFP